MKIHMALNDGTFIYNKDSLIDYLSSLGLDIEQTAQCLITEAPAYKNSDISETEPQGDNWELIADSYVQAYGYICDEVRAHCRSFLSGRKETKPMFVHWLLDFLEDGLYKY